MELSLIVGRAGEKGEVAGWELADLAEEIVLEGAVARRPGKLTFTLVDSGAAAFEEGAPVRLSVDGVGRFAGYVFTRARTGGQGMAVTAYDQLRYLKNRDTYIFSNTTSSEVFRTLCTDFRLRHAVADESDYILPPRIYDDKTLGDMIQEAIEATRAETGRRYMVRDAFGTLEFRDMAGMNTDLLLGDGSLVTRSSYETSIDRDTYNRVKLSREHKDVALRHLACAEDAGSHARWGVLQYFEKIDSTVNDAQMDEQARALLAQKNRVTRRLVLDAAGDWRALPGYRVMVASDQGDEVIGRRMVVLSAVHTIKHRLHTMRLSMEAD